MISLQARVGPAYPYYRGQDERILHPSALQRRIGEVCRVSMAGHLDYCRRVLFLPALSLRTASGTLRFAMRLKTR
jgi:hypothetical protein